MSIDGNHCTAGFLFFSNRSLMETLRVNTLTECLRCFCSLENLRENIFFSLYNIVAIIAKQSNPIWTCCNLFWLRFSTLWPSSYEVKTFPIYVRVETFVRKKFLKFDNVFSSQKFILNFQMNLIKSKNFLYLSV